MRTEETRVRFPHVIQRSDVHEHVATIPAGHKENPTDKPIFLSRLEDVKRRKGGVRTDIAILTVETVTVESHQHTLFAYDDGVPRGSAWDYLTPAQQQECIAENERLIAVAKQFPEMGVYLRPAP